MSLQGASSAATSTDARTHSPQPRGDISVAVQPRLDVFCRYILLSKIVNIDLQSPDSQQLQEMMLNNSSNDRKESTENGAFNTGKLIIGQYYKRVPSQFYELYLSTFGGYLFA